MSIVQARAIALWVFASAALAGCSSVGSFDAEPPHSVDLTGSWMLDHDASQNPQPVLDKLRPKFGDNQPNGPQPDDGTGDNGQSPRGGQQGSRGQRRGSQQVPSDAGYRYNDSFQRTSVINMLRADLVRGEQVTIRQSPSQFSLDYGTGLRTFIPGAKSVVSASWGVADQSSGWKGKEYVIATKPQMGVASTETYGLSKDGKHLLEDLHLGGGNGFPSAELKLVYNRSDKPLPRAVPTSD